MLAPLIAIVGCDGSGKSTLAADLAATLGIDRRVAIGYLGLGSGTIGARIATVPLIGARIERSLAGRARQSRTKGERIPGLATASVIYGFSLLRRRRFRRILKLREAGVIVITDRYPQIEVPGFYDGPGLSAARAGGARGRLARAGASARCMRRWLPVARASSSGLRWMWKPPPRASPITISRCSRARSR